MHVTDPAVFARLYVTRYNSRLPDPTTGIDSSVTSVRLPAFDVLVHEPFPSLNSAQQVVSVQDANFDHACRTRLSLRDFSLNSVSWAATVDPERLELVVALIAVTDGFR